MNSLAEHAGIVTGGSSGIGLDISRALAREGATVYILSRTGCIKEGYGEDLPGMHHIKGDITDTTEMNRVVQEIAGRHEGRLDFLINNAGTSFKCRAEDFPEEEFDRILSINVKAAFSMSQILYPYLKKSPGKGRILNISSMSAHLGFSLVVPYSISKAAVLGLTRGLAIEWANDNICVNSIAPGWFHSKLTETIVDPVRQEKILNRIPLHAFGSTEDLGAMAVFLLGENARYITGQDYALDGGALAYGY